MKGNTKRIFLIGSVLCLVAFVAVGWTTATVIAWVRDLPNRVVVDGDAIANVFGNAATESYHVALRGADSNLKLRVLNEQFEPHIRRDAEASVWIRQEYEEDIAALAGSDDPEISAAASNLLSLLRDQSRTTNGG